LGVTTFEAVEESEVPTLFVAVTVNVSGLFKVSPVTRIGEDEPVPLLLLGYEVTVKLLIVDPPLSVGGLNATDAV